MESMNAAMLLLIVMITYQGLSIKKKLRTVEFSRELFVRLIHGGEFVINDTPLWKMIYDEQISLNINNEYRIESEEEWEIAKTILKDFHKYMIQSYLKGQNWYFTQGILWEANERDALMFMLYIYLSDNESSIKPIVFFKILYIAHMYCAKRPALEKKVIAWKENWLRNYLDDLHKS